jgi:hypothetical protein
MTVRTAAALSSLVLALGAPGCVTFFEIPVEIPLQAKIDVSSFQRVLVVGFLAGGSKSIDPNTETARLLRSQLRTKSELKVVDADVISLTDEVDRRRSASGAPAPAADGRTGDDPKIRNAKDLQDYEKIFADKEFWKKIGEEYQTPLIVTGSVLFTEIAKTGMVSKLQTYKDETTGEDRYKEVKAMNDLKGFALDPSFVFIDGRTGAVIDTETLHEESLYPTTQNTPALSSYFELMDKILPTFLNTLSTQKIKSTRILIK